MKFFTKIAALAVLGAFSISAHAQGLGKIDGYFRVSNAKTGKYVEVTGPFTADPTQDLQAAESKAGTVIYVKAEQTAGEDFYRIKSLRSQGIEVVGDYMDDYANELFQTIFTEQGFDNFEEALWNLVRGGFIHGYTSIGRAAIQTVIFIVAQRLDSEDGVSHDEANELANFADRFNEEVAQYIDLDIRLKPTDGENNYHLYYEIPDLEPVSEWYLKKENGEYVNKDTFEKGFAAMRHYLTTKEGISTGEGLEPYEIAEMKSWGYNPEDKYMEDKNDEGVIVLSYEKIFADPELLFNWLKLNVIKFTDPERCPNITLQGISLKAVSEELQKHRLTQQIISYLPKANPHSKIYLCDGKGGVEGHFDFTSEEGAAQLGDYAVWKLNGIDNNNQKFYATTPQSITKNAGADNETTDYYGAVFYDFPVTATVAETTQLYTLSDEEYLYNDYTYVEKSEAENAGIQTPILVKGAKVNPQLNVADGEPIVTPLVNNPLIGVSNEIGTGKQRVRRNAPEKVEDPNPGDKYGVLLAQDVANLHNYLGIEINVNVDEDDEYATPYEKYPVYIFNEPQKVLGGTYLAFIDSKVNGLTKVPANTVIYYLKNDEDLADGNKYANMVLIDCPQVEIVIGNTETGEEEGLDDDNVPDEEKIKLAAEFDGSGANAFEGHIFIPSELEFGEDKDFTLTIEAPHADNEDDGHPVWIAPEVVPSTHDQLLEAYKNEFLKIQPKPEDADDDYMPGLYLQYIAILNAEDETIDNDLVDGFYLDNELHMNTELEESDNNDGLTSYDFKFDAPCSGIYKMVIKSNEGSAYQFEKVVNIKIFPNLYGEFGVEGHKDKGFNINGYTFADGEAGEKSYVGEDGTPISAKVIKLPKDEEGNMLVDVTNCVAYIPGTYFANDLSANDGTTTFNATKVAPRKVVALDDESTATPSWTYCIDNLDLTNVLDKEQPLMVSVTKNGVSKTYPFYVESSVDNLNQSTGVEGVEAEEGEAVYYNLYGMKVENPEKGVYVKVSNGKAVKVIL